ncbi:MAG: EAL domain-containing protein [Lachnospiraceae bacterium]|nr:EAL domain-containing protein [Lachnospiraceae bacterium]
MEDFNRTIGFKRRILVVDDEEINREILGNILNETYDVSYAEDGQKALEMMREKNADFSLVLLDLLMPVTDGFSVLDEMQKEDALKQIPVIVMTSEKSAEVKSIKHGAYDFITKPYDMPEVILARCERIIELNEDKSIIRAAEKDELTGLYTREFFFEYIHRYEHVTGEQKMDAVVLNIEHFHMINEMYGRETGDEVLCSTASTLKELFEKETFIASRPDADYFYLYMSHRENYEGVFDGLQEELSHLTQLPRIRFRIGVSQDVDKTLPAENRFDHAKLACDHIRGDYTRQLSYYNKEDNDRELYGERLINDMEDAIRNGDFVVFYQPKFNIQTKEPHLRSAEALIRWRHPELGMVSPGAFIPLFESNGLIQKLDRYVWSEAAAQIRKWKETYGITIPVSVNVSRIDIYDPELENRLAGLVEQNGLSAEDLMLEITESAYADNAKGLIEVVNHLRDRGFKIEMDDFGSGYSSLNMLTTIPIDVLKLDMKFVRNMHKDEKSLKLVELIIDIAKFFGVPLVAEGVEDEAQFKTLKEMGCDVIQGYYFSKPIPAEEFETFVKEEKKRRE